MCSNLEESDIPIEAPKIRIDRVQQCKKCQGKPYVVLQKKDVFCRECFYEYGSHKFRSTIGKSRLVKPRDKVLLAFSGGASSLALLDMVEDGLNNSNVHKKLLFSPHILYIRELNYLNEEEDVIEAKVEKIIARMKQSGLPALVSSLEMFFSDNGPIFTRIDNEFDNLKIGTCPEGKSKLKSKLDQMLSLTGKEDYLRLLRQQLIQRIATEEQFKFIFLGQTCTRTAIQMLSDIAQGKGSQITSVHAFIDDRFPVTILKPMREFIKKEIIFWNIMRNNEPVEWYNLATKQGNKASLLKLSESYIQGLENNFPATVYTIFKTGNKLRRPDQNGSKCRICQSLIDSEYSCSASQALILSHQLSKNLAINGLNEERLVCYSCSILMNEMSKSPSNGKPPDELGLAEYLL